MVVIGIIGILSAVIYPLGSTYLRQSRDTARESALRQLAQAHSVYYADHDSSYPDPYNAMTDTHLVGCVRADLLLGKYMNVVPVSPSGKGYDE